MASVSRIHEARTVLRSTFGYDDFRLGQQDIVTAVLQGRDVLAVLPTGGGKSLCYQIPALMFPACTLVISPLVALMTDQVQRLQQHGVAAACLHSGVPSGDVNQILYDAHLGKTKLLYIAPERLESSQFLSALSTVPLSLLAVDEAHCISEWGHDFRVAYRTIPKIFEHRARTPIVALTATATPDVRDDICSSLQLQKPIVIVRGFSRPNLSFRVENTPHKTEFVTQLAKQYPSDPILVYAGSRRRVDTMVDELRKRSIMARGYHAGKPSAERAAIQGDFVNGRANLLIATNAFGMGIDKPDIRHVVHTDLTLTIEAYYQEAGRAGRDGKPSVCTLLYCSEDKRLMDFFIECTYPEEAEIRTVLKYLTFRMKGGSVGQVVLADDRSIAADLHQPVARVRGVLAALERNGALVRTNPTGTAMLLQRATHARLREFAEQQPASRRTAVQAIVRALQGSGPEMGISFHVPAFLKKHGLSPHEFQQAVRAMTLIRLIQFREPDQGGGLVVVADYVTGGTLPVEMETIHQRRNHAVVKLSAMIGYATTPQCKRNYVLRYFGDSEAVGTCGMCSSCTGDTGVKAINVPHDDYLTVVRCVHELNGRFGRNVIADVLSATVSEQVVKYRLDRATSWGAFREYSRSRVLRLVDEAITENLLVRSSGQYPTIAVSALGSKQQKSLPRRLDLTLTAIREVDPGVYGALVTLRDRLASQENAVPSALLSLSALERLAMDKPTKASELRPGDHGSSLFIARYGADVVDAIEQAIRKTVRAIPKVRVDEDVERVARLSHEVSTFMDLAKRLHSTPAATAQLVQRALESGLSVQTDRIVPQELLHHVTNYMRNHPYAKLRHIREHVGAEADLPLLRVAMAVARKELYGVGL